jgi:RNA polymerase sigma factor (sigma-70 family)
VWPNRPSFSEHGDVHLSEDAIQEAFIETFVHISNIYDPASFPGFLRKVIFKHCDRILRKRRIYISLDSMPELPSWHNPAHDLENQENQKIIHNTLISLPLKERQVIALFYIEGKNGVKSPIFWTYPSKQLSIVYVLHANDFKEANSK